MLQVAGCSGFKSSSTNLCSTVTRLSCVKYPSQSEDSSVDMSRIYVFYICVYTHMQSSHIHHIYSVFIFTYRHIRAQIRTSLKILPGHPTKENPTRDPTTRWASPTGGFTSGLFPTLCGSVEGDSLHCCPYHTKRATWTSIEPTWGLFGGWFVVKGLNFLYFYFCWGGRNMSRSFHHGIVGQ